MKLFGILRVFSLDLSYLKQSKEISLPYKVTRKMLEIARFFLFFILSFFGFFLALLKKKPKKERT